MANAAIAAPQVWSDITPEDFCDVIDVNVTGTWNTVMAGAQKIVDGGRGGSIILISSAAGIKVQPFMVHYTASKHAVTGMARAFAAELGKYSIRVNSVHPGPVNTPMGSGEMVDTVMKATETNPQLANMLTPFCRTGSLSRRHRRRGAVAGQRRIEECHGGPDLGRPRLDAILTPMAEPDFAETLAARLNSFGDRPCIEFERKWYSGNEITEYIRTSPPPCHEPECPPPIRWGWWCATACRMRRPSSGSSLLDGRSR